MFDTTGITDQMIALALHVGCGLDEISESRWDSSVLSVNPHKTYYDKSPEYYRQYAADLHAILKEHNIDADTWQEVATLKDFGTEGAYYRIERKLGGYPQKEGEIHYYANGFYHLVDAKGEDENKWHVTALRHAFNGEPFEDTRELHEVDDGEYLVLDDEEADERWDADLENYIDECILPEIKDSTAASYFDREAWKSDARFDGRGHSLSSYDGEEHEIDLDDYSDECFELFKKYFQETMDDFDAQAFEEAWEGGELDEVGHGTWYIFRQN